jgi:hypothetical protein
MRVEGHGHRHAAAFDGPALHPVEDLEVAPMKTVEVAERQHGTRQ